MVWDFNRVVKYNKNGSPFLKLIQREGKALFMAKDYLKDWFKFAKEDYEMAAILLANSYYRGCCIHSQQAIEKCIKGLLIKNSWELERTHNIGALFSFAEKYNINIKIEDEDIEFIDSIYSNRNPVEEGLLPFGKPDQNSASKALVIAANVLKQSKVL